MEALSEFLDKVKLARVQSHKNMLMFPLLAPETEDEPGYITLEEGLGQGSVSIREVSEAGRVPDLLLVNGADRPLLILDGEELVGAKQNRIVNTTMLVRAKSELLIPVSCVEQGRWAYRSPEFDSGKRMMYASLRAANQESVQYSLRRGEGFRSDQGMVWGDLNRKAQRMAARSETGAMADLFTAHEDPLQGYLKAFKRVDCQVGGLFAINGNLVGLDCLGYHMTFGGFFAKLVKSYSLDALDWSREAPENSSVRSETARAFLDQIALSSKKSYPGIGLGESVRFQGKSVSGAALIHEDKILHLAAFRNLGSQGANDPNVPMQRASLRRGRLLH